MWSKLSKFQEGERVIATTSGGYSDKLIGTMLTIKRVIGHGVCIIDTPTDYSDMVELAWRDNELRKITPLEELL